MEYLIFLLMLLTLFLSLGFILVFAYFQYSYSYWRKNGVPYLKPKFPLGNAKHLFLSTSSYTIRTQDWYNELKKKNLKFGGVWDLCRPILVVLDPEYIKDILIRDFQYFINRDFFYNDEFEPIPANLFLSKGDTWKPTRQKFTSVFTSGKMKTMFDSIVKCSDTMVQYIEEQEKKDTVLKQLMASFTIDVIGCCIFGLEVNSFKNPNDEFRQVARSIFQRTTFNKYVRYPLIRMSRTFCTKLGILSHAVGNPEHMYFFGDLLKTTLEYRKKNNVYKPDFIQLLMELYEETSDSAKHFDFNLLVSNTMLFFIAGFDTSSTTMTFALYELANNLEIQEKTRDEISAVLKKHNGKLSYEAVAEMTYLRQVLDESLRLFPPLTTLARVCTKDYQLRDTNITIPKGTPIVIPNLGLGYDPEYFPEPEKFDPDRFSSENKANRHSCVPLPFGDGPRNCIGIRFGLMQSSIGVIQILRNFKLTVSPRSKTEKVLLSDLSFLLESVEPIYLNFERI